MVEISPEWGFLTCALLQAQHEFLQRDTWVNLTLYVCSNKDFIWYLFWN